MNNGFAGTQRNFEKPAKFSQLMTPTVLPDGNRGFTSCPDEKAAQLQ
jgi:hypothetical protein